MPEALLDNPFSDLAFDPNQPRDEKGRWIGIGGGFQKISAPGKIPKATVERRISGIGMTITTLRWTPKGEGSVRGQLDRERGTVSMYGDAAMIRQNKERIAEDVLAEMPNATRVFIAEGKETVWRREDKPSPIKPPAPKPKPTPARPISEKPPIKKFGGKRREVGEKVSGYGAPMSAAVEKATSAIAKVHDDGPLHKMGVRGSPDLKGSSGVYIPGFLGSGTGKIRLIKNGEAPVPTLVHEIGHWIDHKGFGGQGDVATSMMGSERAESREMDVLMKTIEATPTVKKLKSLKRNSFPDTYAAYFNYLDQGGEKFARAYTQWISLRSGDAGIEKHLEIGRHETAPTQWPKAEFEPIAKAFDELFAAKGWLK